MPLYIRDETVDDLAIELMKITGAKTKTDAVRTALMKQIEATKRKVPLLDRIEAARAKADKIGPVDPAFDMKKYTDEMWGDD